MAHPPLTQSASPIGPSSRLTSVEPRLSTPAHKALTAFKGRDAFRAGTTLYPRSRQGAVPLPSSLRHRDIIVCCFATLEVTFWLPHFNGKLRAETAFLKLLHLKASSVGLTNTTGVLIPRRVLVPGTHLPSLIPQVCKGPGNWHIHRFPAGSDFRPPKLRPGETGAQQRAGFRHLLVRLTARLPPRGVKTTGRTDLRLQFWCNDLKEILTWLGDGG